MTNQGDSCCILSGYRVLELADRKGALCAKILADMGADVVRIGVVGESPPVSHLDAGKRGITLNLGSERGGELLHRLIVTADVLIEGYPPGELEELGLGYGRLSETNPRLVMTSITPFGQTGPYSNFKADDLTAGAMGGWLSVCGEPDMPPLKPYGELAYRTASLFAANGILLALWHRHASGRGQHVDISLQECVAATLDHVLVRYCYQGVVARRQGSRHWNDAFKIFPCRDGYILLSLFLYWETLVELLEAEGMADNLADPKWRDEVFRARNVDRVIAVLERWTRSHTVAELVELGQLMHFPWAPVATVANVISSPQLNERGFFVEMTPPGTGKKYKAPGAHAKLSGSPLRPGTHIPAPGEYNQEIYGELGLSAAEITALAQNGVI